MSKRSRLHVAVAGMLLFLAACGQQPPPEPAEVTLTVAITGNGSVTSEPEGIDTAAGTSAATFADGTTVTLTASPGASAEFEGFSPADVCGDGSTATTCVVTLDGDTDVTATFNALETLTVSVATAGAADGAITSDPPGIDTAAGASSAEFAVGESVVLTASVTSGGFAGWVGGDCDGLKTPECSVTIDAGEAGVAAGFNDVQTLTVRSLAEGDGAVEFLGDSAAGQAQTPPVWFEGWLWVDDGGYHDLGWAPFHNLTEAGFRFPNLLLPAGAAVASATIEVTARTGESADYPTTGAMQLSIEGELSTNADLFVQPAPDETPFDITSRLRTSASATWDITNDWVDGDVRQTPDVSNILQEIVDQSGWVSGNAAMFFLKGGTLDDPYRRVYSATSGAPDTRHPTLIVDYVEMPALD